jgi:3',5'-cyclic AMP phosphodiesterase CpdA
MRIQTTGLLLIACLVAYTTGAQQIIVPPYLQPGNASNLLRERKVLIWHTDSIQAEYKVEFGIGPKVEGMTKPSTAKITSVQLKLYNRPTYLYRAELNGLKFDESYAYRVSRNGSPIAESSFKTRTKKSQTNFIVFGDCGARSPGQAKIAYQVFQQKPDFVLVTGDNVYSRGLEKEYRTNFFPFYLHPIPDTLRGAPLMSSIPFYMLLGNHDVAASDLGKEADGLAYFYYNDLPLNAPIPRLRVEATGSPERTKAFEKNTESRFPAMANYSFDYGNVHIACLDSNPYANPLDRDVMNWLVNDMNSSKADWKIVAYHHPAFNTSVSHYDDQQMRLIAPVLEDLKVDLVLAGHVHNYQRSFPLKFELKLDSTGRRYVVTPEGRVDGTFTLDEKFDGATNTKPNGIVYVVSGSGGARLYDGQLTNNPELWKHDLPTNWVPFTAKLVSDIHSFTRIETDGKKLVLKQMDVKGNTFDQITITK